MIKVGLAFKSLRNQDKLIHKYLTIYVNKIEYLTFIYLTNYEKVLKITLIYLTPSEHKLYVGLFRTIREGNYEKTKPYKCLQNFYLYIGINLYYGSLNKEKY